jgi:hypothetical protein
MSANFLPEPRTEEEAQAYLGRELKKLFGNGEVQTYTGKVISIDTEIEDENENIERGIFFAVRWVRVPLYRMADCVSEQEVSVDFQCL